MSNMYISYKGGAPVPNMTDPAIRKLLAQQKIRWAVLPDGRQEALIERRTRLFVRSNGKPVTRRKTPNPSSAKDFRAAFVEHAKDIEHFVPYMYQDVRRKVTVGFGHFIGNEGEALRLQLRFSLKPGATPGLDVTDAIKTDFATVRDSLVPNPTHDKFADVTLVEMSEIDAAMLLDEDVGNALDDARRVFPAFGTYPHGAKLGILDLLFNLGRDRFIRQFLIFKRAVDARDWRTASRESHRRTEQVGETRNRIVRDWFLDALAEEPEFVDPRRR